MRGNSFERFYYEKVALGECCGCAEQIIRTRDLDAQSQEAAKRSALERGHGNRSTWLRRLFHRRGQSHLES